MKKKSSLLQSFNQLFKGIFIAALLIGVYHLVDYMLMQNDPEEEIVHDIEPIQIKNEAFGFNLDTHHIFSGELSYNQFLGEILTDHGISYSEIALLEEKAKEVFDVRNIRAGNDYHIIKEDSCAEKALCFIYEPNPLQYVCYDFRDSVSVRMVDRAFTICEEVASGVINSSLWQSMMDEGINPAVIDLMEDALGSSVSFYHTKVGDQYKVIYEQKYIEDKPIALGRMLGAYYKNAQGEYYSVFYENDQYAGFYDETGRPSKKAFLKSPIKGGHRISSRYNLRRLHPIKKRRIPHLGTDYAAPYGTPIRSVADGVITTASYTRNNGKYVKIKHDRTYQSQYLHMQRFGKGIRSGVQVKQGDIIGYVGSTGLATGPHVCFRFWKNGKQIDHLRENFPPAEPMPESELAEYYKTRDEIKRLLDHIPLKEKDQMLLAEGI